MTSPNGLDPRLLAAVMAAVQAYIDEEGEERKPRSTRLNAWKLAAWQPLRGRAHPLDTGWRMAG